MNGSVHPHMLALTLDAEALDSDDFVGGVESFFKLLKGVTNNATGTPGAVAWHVSVREGSAVVEARGAVGSEGYVDISGAISAIADGLRKLESGVHQRPAFFDDVAMKAARRLSQLSSSMLVRITVDRAEYLLSTQTAASVDAVIEARYATYGSLEGRLEVLSSRGSEKFSLRDEASGSAVTCYIEEGLEGDAYTAFKSRVSAWGPIKYRADGTPVSMRVEGLYVFRDDPDLPALGNVLDILGRAR